MLGPPDKQTLAGPASLDSGSQSGIVVVSPNLLDNGGRSALDPRRLEQARG
jgi:hypothetical protein